MKTKFLFPALLFIGMLLQVGCVETPPKDDGKDETVTYTLSSDKVAVPINEEITFTVTSSKGEDVTAEWNICDELNCFISNKVAWQNPGTHTITAKKKEDATFEADNKLTITVSGSIFTISADKNVIYERETVTFTVIESIDGVEQEKLPTNFKAGVQGEDRYPGLTNTFTKAGVYVIDAIQYDFKGAEKARTNNTVSIIVKEREPIGYEDNFYRRSLLIEGTWTSCYSCPPFAWAIERTAEYLLDDRFVPVAVHLEDDECNVEIVYSSLLAGQGSDLEFYNFPFYIIDWNYTYSSQSPSPNITKAAEALAHEIAASQASYTKTPGLAAETTLTGRTLSIKLKVTPRETGEYLLGGLFVVDGVKTLQTEGDIKGEDGKKYMIQNNVAHQFITSGDNTNRLDNLGTLNADQEYEYNFTYTVPARHDLANSRIVAYVCKTDASIAPYGFFCANAITCNAGESVDYEFEPIYGEE